MKNTNFCINRSLIVSENSYLFPLTRLKEKERKKVQATISRKKGKFTKVHNVPHVARFY